MNNNNEKSNLINAFPNKTRNYGIKETKQPNDY